MPLSSERGRDELCISASSVTTVLFSLSNIYKSFTSIMQRDNTKIIVSEIFTVWSQNSQFSILALKANALPKFRSTIPNKI